MSDLPDFLAHGERARLIPVFKKKESNATSILLATMIAVEEFGKSLLQSVEAPSGQRASITCYSEIVFKGQADGKKDRPDGLIIVSTGRSEWKGLIEAKVDNAVLEIGQVEKYVKLARENEIDAVITISNQFASRPDHHPLNISGVLLRSVKLFHWSWMFLKAEALLSAHHRGVDDPDQAYILSEVLRYFEHSVSGIGRYDRMPKSWKSVGEEIRKGHRLLKKSDEVREVVEAWHALIRSVELELSMALGVVVKTYLTPKQKNDANLRVQQDLDKLINDQQLQAEFEIPDAADRLCCVADFQKKTLRISMQLNAPQDRKMPKSTVTWVRNQLKDCEDNSIDIDVIWPGRSVNTSATLEEIREDQNCVINGSGRLPKAFEISKIYDLRRDFLGPLLFPETMFKLIPDFYKSIGQHVEAWRPKPPQIKEPQKTKKGINSVQDSPQTDQKLWFLNLKNKL